MASEGLNQRGAPMGVKVLGAAVVLACAGGTFMMLRGCQPDVPGSNVNINVEPVTIAGEEFMLDVAADDDSRIVGLGGRESIPERGGMIFSFPLPPRVLGFVMRNCPNPIDVAFLDDAGRILVIHEMPAEEPQRPDEDDAAYERRLKVYSSRFPCRFAVEVAGGTLAKLGVKPGDVIKFDIDGLKKRTR